MTLSYDHLPDMRVLTAIAGVDDPCNFKAWWTCIQPPAELLSDVLQPFQSAFITSSERVVFSSKFQSTSTSALVLKDMAWDTQAKDSCEYVSKLACVFLQAAPHYKFGVAVLNEKLAVEASCDSRVSDTFQIIAAKLSGQTEPAACHDDPLLSTVGFASLKADMDGLKGATQSILKNLAEMRTSALVPSKSNDLQDNSGTLPYIPRRRRRRLPTPPPVGDADVHGTVGTSPSAGTEVDAQTTSPTPKKRKHNIKAPEILGFPALGILSNKACPVQAAAHIWFDGWEYAGRQHRPLKLICEGGPKPGYNTYQRGDRRAEECGKQLRSIGVVVDLMVLAGVEQQKAIHALECFRKQQNLSLDGLGSVNVTLRWK
ncbi:hypothetical protein BSKO_05456 [Bryopsis sp. KO-2023]|nr:hypothetical protein BSKO_05456 [Bryopsis sp. KO-2023]